METITGKNVTENHVRGLEFEVAIRKSGKRYEK